MDFVNEKIDLTVIKNSPKPIEYMLDRRQRESNDWTIKPDTTNTLGANFFEKKPLYIK